jgi:hypothetical protein
MIPRKVTVVGESLNRSTVPLNVAGSSKGIICVAFGKMQARQGAAGAISAPQPPSIDT